MTFYSKYSTRSESARREMTRTPVFVVLERSKAGRLTRVDGVWLTREEAERYCANQHYNLHNPFVYGLPANGELAEALRDDLAAATGGAV